MQGDKIREKFLDFFKERGHLYSPSAPLAVDDPQLLFTIAGMVPFKAFFLGLEKPPASRITSCQLCFRTNDLDRVGETSYHHTFFEMLGNFSFGDYFKEEACEWGLEFVREELGINPGRVWITIFRDDEETFSIWKKLGIPSAKIIRKGEEDNFWAAAEVGPCGPDTEIFFDRGEKMGCRSEVCEPGCNRCSRWVELWNLVFMQYNRDESGKLTPLPFKNVDTGMGLERVATVLQGADDDYHTDLFLPLYNWLKEISPLREYDEKALRVISDHLRGLTFLLAEGIFPSNTGRGYVVRRVLRRAFRYGRKLGLKEPFLHQGVSLVVQMMGKSYSHLEKKKEKITSWIRGEEESFQDTLTRGLSILEGVIEEYKKDRILPGREVFKMYDTYGFPVELTREIAFESGLAIDEEGFHRLMEEQRKKARLVLSERGTVFADTQGLSLLKELQRECFSEKEEVFVGYEKLSINTTLLAIIRSNKLVQEIEEGKGADFVLFSTPFYPEGGGQVGDRGEISSEQGRARVFDTQKKGEIILHRVRILKGKFKKGDRVKAGVDERRREAIARSHTATHLLQAALRSILGEDVKQSGSLVEDDRLRFDFTFSSPLEEKILKRISLLVNEKIRENLPVKVEGMSLEEARRRGALALFEEKYKDKVRLVEIGDFSREVCGGTHLSRTGKMGVFQILSESGIASGIRRIEALTGERALCWLMDKKEALKKIATLLEVPEEKIFDKLREREERTAQLKERVKNLQKIFIEKKIQELVEKRVQVGGVNICAGELQEVSPRVLRETAETIRDRLGKAVVALASSSKGKAFIVLASACKDFPASKLIKKITSLLGGSGGGRWDFAQGGTSHPERVKETLQHLPQIIQEMMEKKREN